MSSTGLDTFDRSVQEANIWLKELMAKLETDDRHVAYRALRASLHALRDRIGPENAVHFGAQLPMLLRGLYYEGWRMSATPSRERHWQAFLDHVARELDARRDVDPGTAARASFDVVCDHVDAGEVAKVVEMFPKELRVLWPGAAAYD